MMNVPNGINLVRVPPSAQSFLHLRSRSIQAVVLFWPAFDGSWFASPRPPWIDLQGA